MKRLLFETLAVLVAGAALALCANLLSPRGLSLTRDYFPAPKPQPGATASATAAKGTPSGTAPGVPDGGMPDGATVMEKAAARLKEKGLQPLGRGDVEQLYRDPRFEQERVLFVDARDDRHYEEGHIPGAYQFDRYFPERYLPALLPACQTAERIVVYCTGGNCEDSEFAALALRDAGIPAERLGVYVGGITEWTAQGGPVETGARRSGVLRPPGKP